MRIGAVGYATSQGLAHLMKSFFDAGVITDPVIYRHSHPSRPTHLEWYPPGTPVHDPRQSREIVGPDIDAVLDRIQVLLAFETFFDWSLIDRCRQRGVKTVLVPMHEWAPRNPSALPDLIICPSELDRLYFPGASLKSHIAMETSRAWWNVPSRFVPIPVRTDLWRQRGQATHFVHNAGNVGHREHKGTREVLRAIPFIKSPLTLTIRAQDGPTFMKVMQSIPEEERRGGGATVRFQVGERPYESLWDGDVLVAPEKFNGLSLPLQEARAAGMLVMTSDRFPHNDWLPREPLIPVSGYHRAAIGGGYLEFDEAEVRPEDVAATMDAWFEKDISGYSASGRKWAEEHSWPALKSRWLEALAP